MSDRPAPDAPSRYENALILANTLLCKLADAVTQRLGIHTEIDALISAIGDAVEIAHQHLRAAPAPAGSACPVREALGPTGDLSTALAEALHQARNPHAHSQDRIEPITGAFDALREIRDLPCPGHGSDLSALVAQAPGVGRKVGRGDVQRWERSVTGTVGERRDVEQRDP
jgi:hypothetical protein